MEETISTAIAFVANHFDTAEKATTGVVGVGLTYAGLWVGKRTCRTVAALTGWTYGKVKSAVTHVPDPVFARLLSHFDDDAAMVSHAADELRNTWRVLETGRLTIKIGGPYTPSDAVADIVENGYNVYPDLTPAEKKVIDRRIKDKFAEVTERDRLTRRAALTAPKTV